MASYIGVVLVTRSASQDKASARKALRTLWLHLIQLSLILTFTLFSTIIAAIAKTVGRLALVRIYNLCLVYLSIIPRCLSAVIYDLRGQTIRPAFMLLCASAGDAHDSSANKWMNIWMSSLEFEKKIEILQESSPNYTKFMLK